MVLASVASILSGYMSMAVMVMIGTLAAASAMIPGGFAAIKSPPIRLPQNYLNVNLALSFAAAFFGGWLTARLAPHSPLAHVGVLATLLLGMSVVSARSHARGQPSWYPVTIAVIGTTGVLLGGLWESWPAGA